MQYPESVAGMLYSLYAVSGISSGYALFIYAVSGISSGYALCRLRYLRILFLSDGGGEGGDGGRGRGDRVGGDGEGGGMVWTLQRYEKEYDTRARQLNKTDRDVRVVSVQKMGGGWGRGTRQESKLVDLTLRQMAM